jgi:hypothetical protein
MDHKAVVIISWLFLVSAIVAMTAMALGFMVFDLQRFLLVAAFAVAGGSIIAFRAWFRQKKAYLERFGRLIQAQFLRVEVNASIDIMGNNPFRIVAQWHDIRKNEIFVFRSVNLWFDPTQFVQDRTIPVYVEPGNPSSYVVDLAFLPRHRT